MADQNDDNDTQNSENWVIPVPNSEAPAYALIPWALFQRLRALANGPSNVTRTHAGNTERPDTANPIHVSDSLPIDADFDRVVPLPTAGGDDFWPKSMDDIGTFDEDGSDREIPLDVLERLLDGEHPLKVFRRYRNMTQKELADQTGLNATYLSQIETRKRRGSTRVYRKLATALEVDIGDLIE